MHKLFWVVIFLYLLTRLSLLGFDMSNSDALRWHNRSRDFYIALGNFNFAQTYQRYHPGVTIMWLVGGAHKIMQPLTYGNADQYPIIDSVSRLFINFALLSLFIYMLFILSQLYSEKVALLFGFLIACEPYLIGIDRWLHLTSLENYLAFASFISIYLWSRNSSHKYLWLSATMFGFALLTKITSIICVPIILFILFKSKNLKAIVTYFSVALLTVFMLFPALWVQPATVITNIYTAVTSAVDGDLRVQDMHGYVNTFYYILVMLLKLSPILIALFVFALKKSDIKVLSYFVIYLVALTLSGEKIERYVVALIMPIALLVSLYLEQVNINKLKYLVLAQFGYLLIVSFVYFPNYSAYYTGFYYGYNVARSLGIYANSGEYYREAALYLNSLGRDIRVFVPNNIDTFSVYFKGKLVPNADYRVELVPSSTRKESDFVGVGPRGYNIVGIYKL